jgi:eukaryotic-like serine/threonine-protein kinase
MRDQTDTDEVVQRLLLRARDENIHEILRDHVVERELGRGGMGAVYLLRHVGSGDALAIKTMLPVAMNDMSTTLFLREIRNASSLKHRNVVEVEAVGAVDGVLFLAMEYCSGGSIADLLHRRGGRLEPGEALELTLQSLTGLEYVHSAVLMPAPSPEGAEVPLEGLVHRDIKPQNLLLSEAGERTTVKIADYGLAKAFSAAGLSGITATGSVGGTLHFMAREQLIDYKYAGPQVDVWSIAACLYLMLTGDVPRDFRGAVDPWLVVAENDAIPIGRRAPAVPPALAAIIDAALREDGTSRLTTARALKEALESYIADAIR